MAAMMGVMMGVVAVLVRASGLPSEVLLGSGSFVAGHDLVVYSMSAVEEWI